MISLKKIIKVMILILVIIGSIFVFSGYHTYKEALKTENWPSVTGTIIETRVIRNNIRYSTSYSPYIKYSYVVENKQYINTVIYSGNMSLTGSYETIKDFIDEYPNNSQVMVYYNPNSPQDSVLIPGATAGHFAMIGTGIFVFAISIVLAFILIIMTIFGLIFHKKTVNEDLIPLVENMTNDNNIDNNRTMEYVTENHKKQNDNIINIDQKYCSNCGEPNPKDAIFCTTCGTKFIN